MAAGQAPCHSKQSLKCQSNSSKVGTSSCDPTGRISDFWKDESIWEIWIWQSLGIFKRWDCHGIYFFLLKEFGSQLCLVYDASLPPLALLHCGFLVPLWAYGPFTVNPVSGFKLHWLAVQEGSDLWTKLIQNLFSIVDSWCDVLVLQVCWQVKLAPENYSVICCFSNQTHNQVLRSVLLGDTFRM